MISCETECQRFDLLPIVEASVSLQMIADADISMHLQLYDCRPTAITARRVLTLRHIPRYPRENSRLMINRKCMTYIVNPRRILKKTKYTHTQTRRVSYCTNSRLPGVKLKRTTNPILLQDQCVLHASAHLCVNL